MRTVSSRPATPLMSPGHEAEWAAINREEAEQMRALNMALTPVQRLEEGQRLSQQAVSLLAASIRAGHAPRRAYWS
jgi:mannose/cellobiose epimerase-like protein (N-acyl-D-glucosamine 2-epimerase family)